MRQRKTTFRAQLIAIIVIGALLLAGVTSLAVSWLASRSVFGFMQTHWSEMASAFAAQARLVLLVGSKERAERIIAQIATYPQIKAAAIFDAQGQRLAHRGDESYFENLASIKTQGPLQIKGSETNWLYRLEIKDDSKHIGKRPFPSEAQASRQHLGALVLIVSKHSINQMVTRLSTANGMTSLIIAALICGGLVYLAGKLTAPLHKLSRTMRLAQTGQKNLRADLEGSLDIVVMEQDFNTMMTKIDHHAESLENEVKLRTHELAESRDAALSVSATRSKFFAAVSHEMRTPLTAVIGYIDLVLRDFRSIPDCNPEHQQFLTSAIDAGNDLADQIDKILTIGRIESGTIDLASEIFDPNEAINRAVEIVRPMLHQANNQLHVDCTQGVTLTTDQDKFFHIVLNLLSNAAKFTEHGSVKIRTGYDGKLFSLVVEDTGCGIPQPQLNKIFEPYQQAEHSTPQRHRGTGLGLAVTQHFVKLLGGTISVVSTLNAGTTFTVTLPSLTTETLDRHRSSDSKLKLIPRQKTR